ncbi:MAG: hypothetical protein ABI459_07710 [Deltaproteobacteria bacterium]
MAITTAAQAKQTYVDWLFPQWPAGSTFHLQSGGVGAETHTTAGHDKLGFRVKVVAADGSYSGSYWTDEHGQTTAWRRAGGTATDRYIPNDCSATLGVCSYTEFAANSTPEARIRTTVATTKGVTFKITTKTGEVIQTGVWTLDDQGFVQSGWSAGPDGERYPITMIGIPIKAN